MNEALLSRQPVQRVQAALDAAGAGARVIALEDTARTAQDAANALGCELGAIVKSLVFRSGDTAVMALVAGDRQCDLKVLRDELGLPGKPKRADADFVREKTGFSIGGVSPLGHPGKISILIDQSISRFDPVFAAAGHPHCVYSTSFKELVRSTSGKISEKVGC